MEIEKYKPINTPVIIIEDNNKNKIYLKDETKQYTAAFKYRGVYNKFSTINLNEYEAIITASTGNHGQAVSLCSKLYEKKCYIVLPFNTPKIKKEKIVKNNAELIMKKELKTYNKCQEYAIELAKEHNYLYIPSFDDYEVIEGHKTIFEETKSYGDFDYCFCPVGGGGLISAALISESLKKTNIIGVEIENNDAMNQSLQKNERISIDLNISEEASFCEGILVSQIGKIPFEYAKQENLTIETVSIRETENAIRKLAEFDIVAEGAGAASLAAALKYGISNKKILCVVSGGNIDNEVFERIINQM